MPMSKVLAVLHFQCMTQTHREMKKGTLEVDSKGKTEATGLLTVSDRACHHCPSL